MIDPQRTPKAGPAWPFDDRLVLLAVPVRIGLAWGGAGLDPSDPFSFHIARWIFEEEKSATREGYENIGSIFLARTKRPNVLGADQYTRY